MKLISRFQGSKVPNFFSWNLEIRYRLNMSKSSPSPLSRYAVRIFPLPCEPKFSTSPRCQQCRRNRGHRGAVPFRAIRGGALPLWQRRTRGVRHRGIPPARGHSDRQGCRRVPACKRRNHALFLHHVPVGGIAGLRADHAAFCVRDQHGTNQSVCRKAVRAQG